MKTLRTAKPRSAVMMLLIYPKAMFLAVYLILPMCSLTVVLYSDL